MTGTRLAHAPEMYRRPSAAVSPLVDLVFGSRVPLLVRVALGVLFGDLVSPCIATPVVTLLLCALLLSLLALVSRRTAGLALFAAGLCAGASLTGRLAPPLPDAELGVSSVTSVSVGSGPSGPSRIRATVQGAPRGREADVLVSAVAESGGAWTPRLGRMRVVFPSAAPPSGAMFVAAGTVRGIPRHATAGEPGAFWPAARAHVTRTLYANDVLIAGPDVAPSPATQLVHAGLIAAMAGRPGEVPPEEKLLLQRTGTWHLIAVSGLQVGIVAGVAWFLARWLCAPLVFVWPYGGLRWPAAIAASGAAIAFTLAAGSPPSAVRATVLAVALACGRALGVAIGAWEGLSIALCCTLLMDPCAVDHIGFQLSFSAIAGILLWSSRVTRWVPLDAPRALHLLASSLGATLGATFGTLPIVAWHFQTLSPLSPLTNLLVGPILGTVGTPAAVAGFALAPRWGPLGAFLLTVADTATDLSLRVLSPLDVEPWHPAVCAGGAFLLALAALSPRHPLRVLVLLTLAVGMRWPLPPEDGRLIVQFLAIGQGDGAIIDFPDGRVWLVDTGPSPDAMLEALRRQGVTHLDRVILSHPHPDHDGGLEEVLRNLVVDTLVVPRAPHWSGRGSGESEQAYARLLGLARQVAFAQVPAPATLLHPWLGWTSAARDPVNDESLVFRLDFGRRRFLFSGDVEEDGEAELVAHHAADLRADVLKVPHHGSRTSSSEAFVAAVNPAVAVISCGEDNRFRHPNLITLARYRGRRVYRTDRDGTVIVSTDGADLQVDLPDPDRTDTLPNSSRDHAHGVDAGSIASQFRLPPNEVFHAPPVQQHP